MLHYLMLNMFVHEKNVVKTNNEYESDKCYGSSLIYAVLLI